MYDVYVYSLNQIISTGNGFLVSIGARLKNEHIVNCCSGVSSSSHGRFRVAAISWCGETEKPQHFLRHLGEQE